MDGETERERERDNNGKYERENKRGEHIEIEKQSERVLYKEEPNKAVCFFLCKGETDVEIEQEK